jgi:hypothetical protein
MVSWPRSPARPSWPADPTLRSSNSAGVRPALVADGLAELQVRWPTVPIASCETRQLAKEWVYRYLAAAHTWANTVDALAKRLGTDLNRPKVSLAFTANTPA